MIVNQDDYFYVAHENIVLEASGLTDIGIVARIWRIKGSGDVAIYEDETKENLIYSGPLPYTPSPFLVLDGFYLDGEKTLELVCEEGKGKDILSSYLNTTEGMSAVSTSFNDDSTFSFVGLSDFRFNGVSASTIYQSSNHYTGFGTSTSQLYVFNRDGCSTAIYKQYFSVSGIDVVKVRFEGYTAYNNRVESTRLIYELFITSANDIFLYVIKAPTNSSYLGTSKLVCGSITIPLTLSDGSQVSFYHQDEEGKSWDVKYEMYLCSGRAYYEEVYLLKAQDRYYRYAGETLEELQETELSGAVFYEYGAKEAPSASLLLPLSDFTLYKWKYGQSVKSYHANVVGTPHPQTITCYVDASHPSITGFKTITAQYSGAIPLSYTLDDGETYTDTTLQEFLNLDPAELYASLPESMQMTLIFTLQGDATITSFKITYIN